MKVEKVVNKAEWEALPQRVRNAPPEIAEIVQSAGRAAASAWVVVSLDAKDKKRLQTIKRQIQVRAALAGFEVRMELRGGNLGVQKVG